MEQRSGNRRLVGALIGAWLVLAVVAVAWGINRFETDLEDRVDAAVVAGGFPNVDVQIEGRDVTVGGASSEELDALVATLEDLEGVRSVEKGVEVLSATVTTSTPTTDPPPTSTTTTTTIPAAPELATLVATLEPGSFRLSGVVPDQETADRLLEAANIAYAPFVESDLSVSPDVDSPAWLAAAPTGLALLPMITTGTLSVEGEQIQLTGEAPNPEFLGLYERTVAGVFGLDDITNDVEITNLTSPDFMAKVSDGTLHLVGTIPDEGVREIIVGGAVASYGSAAVVDELVVEEDLYTAFWVYTTPGIFQLFSPFPEYEFRVANGVTSGAIRSGASFAFGSAELTPELQGVLDIGAAILTRDFSLGTVIEGHTDSVGSAEFNQGLSDARAAAAFDYLVASGVAPDRLKAVGLGESQPAESNATSEGRTANRRIEFEFGPASEMVGGS